MRHIPLGRTPSVTGSARATSLKEGGFLNQRLGKFLGIEGLQIVDALAHAGVFHGDTQLLGDGDGDAALGGAVQLGEDDAGDTRRLLMKRTESIIYSMTPEERRNPSLLNPSRKRRIADGAGVDISEVNRLVKQFEQARKMMKQFPSMMGGKRGRRGKFQMPF